MGKAKKPPATADQLLLDELCHLLQVTEERTMAAVEVKLGIWSPRTLERIDIKLKRAAGKLAEALAAVVPEQES
jgi:hypothetical protein